METLIIPQYTKWQEAEDATIAFNNVKSGEWNFERFDAWLSHTVVSYSRDVLASQDPQLY